MRIIPIENKVPAATPIFLYPKYRINGPFINPSDIANAEFMFIINEMSTAGIFISANLSLKISPKFVMDGANIIYGIFNFQIITK